MSYYVHHVRGRLRVRHHAWKRDAAGAERACARLSALPGVQSIRPNEMAGSLVIHYDHSVTGAEELLNAVQQQLGTVRLTTNERLSSAASFRAAPALRHSRPGGDLQQTVARAAATYLIEKALEQSLVLLLSNLL